MKWCIWIALGVCLSWLPALVAEEAPEFSEKSASEQFSTAKELFASGEWKDAEKLFKECQKQTDRAGKKIIKGWIAACKGGRKLARVEMAIAKKNWRGAHAQLAELHAKYGKTPLGSRLEKLTAQVDSELFVALATFEETPPTPERRAAGIRSITDAKINTKPEYVKSGSRSLRWNSKPESDHTNYLALARFESGTLEEVRFLHLSIYNPDKVSSQFTLIFDMDNLEELARSGPLQARIFFKQITLNRVGWSDLRIDLKKDLSTFANVVRGEVEGVGLSLGSTKPKTIYIDDVKFER